MMCVLASKTTLQNGKLANDNTAPCFLIDATGTHTADRYRMIYCTTYFEGHVYPIAFCFAPSESIAGCSMLVQALIKAKIFVNSKDVTIITDAGDAVNSPVGEHLDQVKRGHCYAHLINTDLWNNKNKFSTLDKFRKFNGDIKRVAR